MDEQKRMRIYKKNKSLEKLNNPKMNLKSINLDDYTLQEIENDINLQIIQHKRNKIAQMKQDRDFTARVLDDLRYK